MKHNIYRKLFGGLAAATLLLTTSCKDELFGENGNGRSDDVTVSFTLTPEASTTIAATRAADGHVTYPDSTDKGMYGHISDGSKADVLIYAVYDEQKQLLMGYSSGTDEELKELGFDHGNGQTIKKIDKFPVTINLTLKRGSTYTVAFWAQSSKTKAYNTADLKKVEVLYSEINTGTSSTGNDNTSGAETQDLADGNTTNEASKPNITTTTPNNDEFRDAFCRAVTVKAGDTGIEQNVLLYRPLAQINVGTSGFDFETVTRNATKKYLYSKIRLNRVARYLDVVADSTYTSTTNGNNPYDTNDANKTAEAFAVVDFGYAPLPAYVNYRDRANLNMYDLPEYPSYTIWDWTYNTDYTHPHEKSKEDYEKEEFLKVHPYKEGTTSTKFIEATKDGDEDGYRDYANLTNYSEKQSETFKYLSMCYVLTSSTKDESILLNNVKMWMATDPDGADSILVVDLNNVPAQRNWRTNIIGNLLTEQTYFDVMLDRDFAGEYNGWKADDDWEWSGPLAKGVFYDAKNDEIQISDVDGLIWFQRMVNGDLRVRTSESYADASENKPAVGAYYNYYITGGSGKTKFEYNGYSEEDYKNNETLKKRILKATHQDKRQTGQAGWPYNKDSLQFNNFHFTGATVKLMADIDLSGIEWIPIGMDYKVAEFLSNYKDNDRFSDLKQTNRGFYGTFDGNGHTIYNLTTKRFSANVDDDYVEQETKPRNYDALPWLGRGLFGAIGGSAVIKNVKLYNVDIKGSNGVGGIVGIANGDDIKIQNCIVDGGQLTATPMYRNDKKAKRSFARGTYLGGIVGYFNTRKGEVTDCTVKNLTIKGYRQVGGLIGTIDKDQDGNGSVSAGKDANSDPKTIANNTLSNLTIIASQLHFPFGLSPDAASGSKDHVGFGWGSSAYDLYSSEWIGGDTEAFLATTRQTYINGHNNNSVGVTFAEMTETKELRNAGKDSVRVSTIKEVPLQYMPALSSWFTDEISLSGNYYGKPSAHKIHNLYKFAPKSEQNTNNTKYYYPMELPLEVEIHWDEDTPNVGVYVESVKLDGKGGLSGRSVITPINVDDPGACSMYVTARCRNTATDKYDTEKNKYAKATSISNVVLRGEPYAYTGLLLAPNENMSRVELDSVYIYDVYQTIALDNQTGSNWNESANQNQWPKSITPNNIDLVVRNSNLRGYTVPGSGWNNVSYTTTTFEEGTYISAVYRNDEEEMKKAHTYKVEAETTFNGCYFKAPYIIDIATGGSVTFAAFTPNEGVAVNCQATATSTKTVKLEMKTNCKRIVIDSDVQGNPIVFYYMNDDTYYYCTYENQSGTHYSADGQEITDDTTSPARRR